jgi:hypothetical protein
LSDVKTIIDSTLDRAADVSGGSRRGIPCDQGFAVPFAAIVAAAVAAVQTNFYFLGSKKDPSALLSICCQKLASREATRESLREFQRRK